MQEAWRDNGLRTAQPEDSLAVMVQSFLPLIRRPAASGLSLPRLKFWTAFLLLTAFCGPCRASEAIANYFDERLGQWEIKPVGVTPTNRISPAKTIQTITRKGAGRDRRWISKSVSWDPEEGRTTSRSITRLLGRRGFRTRSVSGSNVVEGWGYPGGRYVSIVKVKDEVMSRTNAKWSLRGRTLKIESNKRLADGKPEWISVSTAVNRNKTTSKSQGSSREWTTFVGRRIR